jgi:hypothetical protein
MASAPASRPTYNKPKSPRDRKELPMTPPRLLVSLVGLVLASPVGARDVASGPEAGKKVPVLKVFDATGSHANQELDYAAERADRPTVYVFVRADQWDRPMARFLRELDKAVARESVQTYMVAVWLTDDADKTKQYLPVAQRSLTLEHTALTCFTGDKAGPEGWGLSTEARLTAVVARRGRVMKAFGYQSVNETDVPAVQEAVRKAVAGN